jgi:hypothetical protein
MSSAIQALLALTTMIAAALAMATLAGAVPAVLGGIVVLVAILVFTRAIMAFAAEPGEAPRRSGPRR